MQILAIECVLSAAEHLVSPLSVCWPLLVSFDTNFLIGQLSYRLPACWVLANILRREVKANGGCDKYRQRLFRDIPLAAFHSFPV